MAARSGFAALLAICCILKCTTAQFTNGESRVLTPPYFNLAVGRNIQSSSTCGENVAEEELFCKLTGANPDTEPDLDEYTVIQGQLCDVCDPSRPDKAHPANQAIDGTKRWWQSPPLSRGIGLREVNLTIDLGQEFHVAYVFIKMANSPRPGVFALERSVNNGADWLPWQFFADTPSNCHKYFGEAGYTDSIMSDDSVVCTTQYSQVVPLEGGEIVVSLVNNRPSADNFSYSQTLQDWTKATAVRLRLLETKTLQGHLMAVTQQDPTVTRRYFYSIKDISIGGRCVCNGHASVCDKADPADAAKLLCRCQHNTCGSQCETCCPGYVQKPWKPATLDGSNECEPCQCHGHSTECIYDDDIALQGLSMDIYGNFEGGGVCQNCRHNTEGINCEKCSFGFYRDPRVGQDSPNACRACQCDLAFSTGDCEDGNGRCKCRTAFTGPNCDRCNFGYFGYPNCVPCECNFNGTQGGVCEVGGGQCPCKPNYDGLNCDRCAYGYFGFPDCQSCQCDRIGSSGSDCDAETGQCYCNSNYGDRDCSSCSAGNYNYPSCQLCSCDPTGTTDEICDADNGLCECKENFGGTRCERCAPGFFRYPYCTECGCQQPGSRVNECDNSGQCICNYNFAGQTCDRCAPGYYKYPECSPCNCDTYGSHGLSCDQTFGQCGCRSRFEGLTCDKCKPNFYIYPYCEECNCNPAGAREIPGYPLGGCGAGQTGRLCECKERVTGKICDTCKPGFWNLDLDNRDGCEDCGCYRSGTLGGSNVCGNNGGQCMCRTYTTGRTCDTCTAGTYNLEDYHYYGCQDCGCDAGGSLQQACDKSSGQCNCRPRVNGRRCDRPLTNHFVPTLYHILYEMEDGRTETGGAVRYGFDWNAFPEYSWRGYAIFSRIQDEVLVDVDIDKPSLYRLVFKFVNPEWTSVTADVTLTPQTSTDVQQTSTVVFPPTKQPEHVTVSGAGVVSTFVLNPGRWSISLKTSETLYVDYVVLLPQAYYEATVLQEKVNRPCTVPADSSLCRHHVYVDMSSYTVVRGTEGFINVGGRRHRTQLYPDKGISDELGTNNMAYLNPDQTSMMLSVTLPKPGKYVLVLKYHSAVLGRNQELTVDVTSPIIREQGRFILPGCPYSSLCRQVMTDENRDPKVFEITDTSSYLVLTLTGQSDIDLAIDEIIAIPLEEWDLEYIQPQLKCIRQDLGCIDSRFVAPTGTTKAEFESGPNVDRVETEMPPHILDTSIKIIKLDGSAPSINVKLSVQNTGPYAFIVHYFQPHHVGFDVDVDLVVDGLVKKGKFHAAYCPGVSGCRAPLEFDENGQTIDVDQPDVVLYFNSTSPNPLWVDYVMAVPEIHFRQGVLDVLPVDKSAEFIKKCGQNHFYIDSETDGFCQEAVFSLTTDYNNGAMSCDCSPEGSRNFACGNFGGQCECRPNVIGRACTQCANGFYDFPNCKRCNCPYGLCDPESGQCVCPPRVTGANCDTCLPRTFGFDKYIGCEECNCDPDGVTSGNLECDVTDGQCSCKGNIAGRRCDECMAGYWNFPQCRQCNCNTRGTTGDICDEDSARCLCKENVEGPQCSQCKQDTFYLEERNQIGCTDCFCFGKTSKCQSVQYRRSEIRDMKGWGLSNLYAGTIENRGRHSLEARIDASNVIDTNEPIYWLAPSPFLGNKITSYGGKLIYTVRYRVPLGSSGTIASDVRIMGNNMTLEYIGHRQPEPAELFTTEVDMLETSFSHVDSGVLATREQFMMALANIESMSIRASYYDMVTKIILNDVQMDIATPQGTGAVARNVEMCDCPSGYVGTSCEQCSPGYYRSQTGSYLGRCIPCQCNGHAETCNPETGVCNNCQDDYDGPQCLTCREGYYQDSNTGRCTICSCPMGTPGNNFARTCLVNEYGITCVCKDGYIGERCDSCDLGYWGDPTVRGGSCQPCDCNGNININDPRSCDIMTGECLLCINSTGDKCERCEDWFWGDSVNLKNCQPCTCDKYGSELCDAATGSCLCKPNVIGEYCEECQPGTFGFDSGRGCSRCDCGEASYSEECDIRTGQCDCRPGVMGRACDQCEPRYWNYGPLGCQSCQCESEGAVTCDTQTGVCQCLPGVTGPTCNECMERWILVPDAGCLECDSCVHLLLDDVDTMDVDVTIMIEQLQNIHVGVTAIKRLDEINSTVFDLRPEVDALIANPTDPNVLDALKTQLEEVQRLADSTNRNSDRTLRESDLVKTDAADTRKDAEDLLNLAQMAADAASQAVQFAENVRDGLQDNIANENLDDLLEQAEEMLQEIRERDFKNADDDAEEELQNAQKALDEAKKLMMQVDDQINRTRDLQDKMDDIESRLQDLINSSRHSLDNSKAALDTNVHNERLQDDIDALIEQIKQLAKDASMMVDMAKDMLDEGRRFLLDADKAYKDLERELSKLDQAKNNLKLYTDDLAAENVQLRPLVDNATEHALKLQNQADILDSLISDTRDAAAAALNASNAYQTIVKAIDEAENASKVAVESATEALVNSNGLAERARKSKRRSLQLKETADSTKEKVTDELQPRLDDAVASTDNLENMNINIRDQLDMLIDGMNGLPDELSQRARDAATTSDNAQRKAEEAKIRIEVIEDKLPEDLDKVYQIGNDIDDINSGIKAAEKHVNDAVNLVPRTVDLMDSLTVRATEIDVMVESLRGNITDLYEQILLARSKANQIGVGLNFFRNTTLQVRNPQNIQDTGSYTKLSMYIKTDEADSFLAYVGSPNGVGPGNTDFIAVEIIGGYVTMTYDLGTGIAVLNNQKIRVDDGDWHHVVAERIGRTGTVTIRTQDQPDQVVTTESPGTNSVLNLNPDTVRFFVGGVPMDARGLLGDKLNRFDYAGCIEELQFDGTVIGLWNFVQGQNNNHGCFFRKTLLTQPATEFKFNGKGYAIIFSDRVRPASGISVNLDFRTYAEDGILFLGGRGDNFMSLELRGGRVLFQYDLGTGPAQLWSKEAYNDGQWHSIFGKRLAKNGLLKVDDVTLAMETSKGFQSQLDMDTDRMFVGGYSGEHPWSDVTQQSFDGCIRKILLGTVEIDLSNNKGAIGMSPGCSTIARLVSFDPAAANNYIAMESVDVSDDFSLTMKVKSMEEDGLLFYVTDDSASQDNALSLSMVEGKIIVKVTQDGQQIPLESNQASYNDGHWHYITINKYSRDISMGVDDNELVQNTLDKRRVTTTSPLYFGGFPAGFLVVDENVGTQMHFSGCLGDVTVNGRMINFAEAPPTDQLGVSLAACPILDPTPPPSPLPSLPSIVLPPETPPPGGDGLKCALDPRPDDVVTTGDEGTCYSPGSRLEYTTVPGDIKDEYEFSLEFKTTNPDGLLFYVSDDRHTDYVALYIKDGYLIHSFDNGDEPVDIELNDQRFDDGKWYTAVFWRNGKKGKLTVGEYKRTRKSSSDAVSINETPPYYLGGVPEDQLLDVNPIVQDVGSTFEGSIRNAQLSGRDLGTADRQFGTRSCAAPAGATEPGVFFHEDDGYITLKDEFSVGLDIDISLDIRPRSLSGVLLSVDNPAQGDYLVLQMVDGNIIFNVDNGGGELKAEYQAPYKISLCDGNWHTIKVTKAKNVVSMEVDSTYTLPGIGQAGVSSTDTNDPLYFGGVPSFSRGIKTTEKFIGCMRNVMINKQPVNLSQGAASGKVSLDGCPAK